MSHLFFDFNKYAGKEINVLEEKKTWTSCRTGLTQEYTSYSLDKTDPVTSQMLADIQSSDAYVRIWLPDSMGTMDWQPGRMNIRISKNDKGKWHIEPKCSMG